MRSTVRGADAARRHVDDALGRQRVGRVHQHAQVGEHVLHLGAGEELHAADHHVGDALAHQRLFQRARLGVGAVEDGDLAPRPRPGEQRARSRAATKRASSSSSAQRRHGDLVAARILGPQRLALAPRVARHHRAGGGEDGAGGAVVLLQADDHRVGIVALEVEDVADLGAAPAVDRLVVVADHAQVAVARGEQVGEPVLHRVGVLVLVDQHVQEAVAVAVEHVRVLLEQAHRAAAAGRRSRARWRAAAAPGSARTPRASASCCTSPRA